MQISALLAIVSICGTYGLLLPSTLREAMKFANTIPEESYNTLMQKIDTNKISDLVFSTKLDSVIAQNEETDGILFHDYSITKINPYLLDSITDNALKHNIHTVFLSNEPNPVIENALGALNVLGNIIFPVMFVIYIVALIRSRGPGGPGGPGPMGGGPMFPSGGLRKDVMEAKENMKKANITLSSFAGSEEIMEECTEIVSYITDCP